jgi:DNA-binding transcriptional MerR regulator
MAVQRIKSGWTTKEAAKLAGLPANTVLTWLDRGVIKLRIAHGKGRGLGYRFTDTDVVGLTLLANLRKRGVALQQLRPMLKELRKYTGRDSNLAALAKSRLVLMDKRLYVLGSDNELVDLLSGQQVMQAIVCPPLEELLQQIRERANKDEALRERFEKLPATNILRAA